MRTDFDGPVHNYEQRKKPQKRCEEVHLGRQCLLVKMHSGSHEFGLPSSPIRYYPVHNMQPCRAMLRGVQCSLKQKHDGPCRFVTTDELREVG